MFKQKISILINSKVDREKLFDEFEILLGAYCRTGQVQGEFETPYVSGNEIISCQTTIEKSSLSKKYNDKYVNLHIRNLEEWCNSNLKTEIIGKSIPFHKGVCTCKVHLFFMLLTYAFNESSPIDCGTCNKAVPIYRFKGLTYEDRQNISAWETSYKACDGLQLGCTVGEKWATKQLSDPNSELSRQGIEICNRIKELTGVPVYYYLFNYRHITPKQDKVRKCPSCNGNWLLKEQLHYFYDFKCDRCRLLSSITSYTR